MNNADVEIYYPAYPHQRIFRSWRGTSGDEQTPVKAIVVGYGGGKTHAFVREMFRLAVENAPIPVLCIEPTYPMVRDILAVSFQEFFDEQGIEYKLNRSSWSIYVPAFRANIWMRSGDNADALKGPNVAAAGIDEPFIQDAAVYKQITARVRHPKAKEKLIVLSGTPEGMGWGEQLLQPAQEHRVEDIDVDGKTLRMHVYDRGPVKWVQTSSEMNTALGAGFFELLRQSHTAHETRAYIGGEFVNLTQGRVYYAYSPDNDKGVALDANLPVVVCCDFNATECPMSWVVLQEQETEIRVRYSLSRQYTNTEAMCEYLESVIGRPAILRFYGDYSGMRDTSNSGQHDWEIIRRYWTNKSRVEVRTKPCKSVRGGVSAVNALLCAASGQRRLFLNPGDDTQSLRLDFERVTWKTDSGKQEDKDPRRTHASDAIRYFCDYEYPIVGKPVYTRG